MKYNLHLFRRTFFPAALGMSLLISGIAFGQTNNSQDNQQQEEIIIKRKGNLDKQLNIQINKDQININGKPLSEYKGGDIDIMRRKTGGDNESMGFQSLNPQGNMQLFGNGFNNRRPQNSNKALLGVYTRKDSSQAGAYIMRVSSGSAADKGGLQSGDIITAVNSDQISSPEDLVNAIGNYDPGTSVTISFTRDGKKMDKQVSLTDNNEQGNNFMIRPRRSPLGRQPFMQMPPNHFRLYGQLPKNNAPKLGMTVQDGGKTTGVVVISIERNSAADEAGIKKGDYITKFAGQPVNNVQDIVQAKNNNSDNNNVSVEIVRKSKTMTLHLNMPKDNNKTDL